MHIWTRSACTRLKVFVIYETLVRIYHFFRNAHRLMSLVDFPRSPKSGTYAGLGLCYSHAAYCHFYMFESLDVGGGGGGRRGGGKRGGEWCEDGSKIFWWKHTSLFFYLRFQLIFITKSPLVFEMSIFFTPYARTGLSFSFPLNSFFICFWVSLHFFFI